MLLLLLLLLLKMKECVVSGRNSVGQSFKQTMDAAIAVIIISNDIMLATRWQMKTTHWIAEKMRPERSAKKTIKEYATVTANVAFECNGENGRKPVRIATSVAKAMRARSIHIAHAHHSYGERMHWMDATSAERIWKEKWRKLRK